MLGPLPHRHCLKGDGGGKLGPGDTSFAIEMSLDQDFQPRSPRQRQMIKVPERQHSHGVSEGDDVGEKGTEAERPHLEKDPAIASRLSVSRHQTQGCHVFLTASEDKELFPQQQWPQEAQGGAWEGRLSVLCTHVTKHLFLQLVSLELFQLGQTLPWDAETVLAQPTAVNGALSKQEMRKCGKNTLENVCIGRTGEGTHELFSSFQAAPTVTGSRRADAQGAGPWGRSRKSLTEEGRAPRRLGETSCLLAFPWKLCCQFKSAVSLDPWNVRGHRYVPDSLSVFVTLNWYGARAFPLGWIMLGDVFEIKVHSETGCLANNKALTLAPEFLSPDREHVAQVLKAQQGCLSMFQLL